ncbi:MAG: protease complex subunit PrcB family protein [Planctomycetota bacterium]
MSAWIWLGTAALGVGLMAIACRSKPVDPVEPAAGVLEGSMPVEHLLDGSQSGYDCEGLVVCRDTDSFAELWRKHASRQLPAPAVPDVDFNTQYVLALFAGSRPSSGYSVHIDGVTAGKRSTMVFAREQKPDPGLAQATVMVSPFTMVLVPQFDGPAELIWESRD